MYLYSLYICNHNKVEEIKEWNEEHELDDDYISLHEYEIVA